MKRQWKDLKIFCLEMGKLSKKKLYEYYSSQEEDRERMYLSDPFRKYCQERRLVKIKELVETSYGNPKEPLILDIGCGDGFCTSFVINGLSFKHLIGLDLSTLKLEKAKKQLGKFIGVIGDAESLPFPENFFDCIFCFETLEHLLDPLKVMQEIKRVLKPEGLCFISIPFDSPWQEKIVNINKRFKSFFNIGDGFNEHIQFFPMKRVTDFLRESGLELISSVRVGFKFPFQETLFKILGSRRIKKLNDSFSQRIPIGAFGYKGLSLGNEFLLLSCKQKVKNIS